jgi:protein-tyrosine phosphatase
MRRRGYELSDLRARQVEALDFERFDLILAMDHENLAELRKDCPPQHAHKLRRLMEFAPAGLSDVVADPYYGGKQGFETVLDHVEAACAGLLAEIRGRIGA